MAETPSKSSIIGPPRLQARLLHWLSTSTAAAGQLVTRQAASAQSRNIITGLGLVLRHSTTVLFPM